MTLQILPTPPVSAAAEKLLERSRCGVLACGGARAARCDAEVPSLDRLTVAVSLFRLLRLLSLRRRRKPDTGRILLLELP